MGEDYVPMRGKFDIRTNLGGYRNNMTESQLEGAPKYDRNTDWDWSDRSRDRYRTPRRLMANIYLIFQTVSSSARLNPQINPAYTALESQDASSVGFESGRSAMSAPVRLPLVADIERRAADVR
jgi:hypothetical protein